MDLVKFSLLRRRAGIDRAAFARHWGTRHVEVLLAAGHASYNVDYVQNRFVARPDLGFADDAYDGAAQLVQPAGAAAGHGFQDDPRYLRDVRPDEDRFLDVDGSCAIFTRPRVISATRRPGRVKLMIFYAWRRGGPSDGAAAESGGPGTGRAADGTSSVVRYDTVAGGIRTFTSRNRGARPIAFDGVLELAFEDLPSLERSLADPRIAAVPRDPRFDAGGTHAFIATAETIYDQASPARRDLPVPGSDAGCAR